MNIEEKLQHEFAPPLDTALITALRFEYNVHEEDSDRFPALKKALSQLADAAERQQLEVQLAEQDSEQQSGSTSLFRFEDGHLSPFTSSSTPSETSSISSLNANPMFNDALSFLIPAFLRIPPNRILHTLRLNARGTDQEPTSEVPSINMEEVVTSLLSLEYILELEERGLDALEDDPDTKSAPTILSEWIEVRNTRKTRGKGFKGRTVVINDVRQQHQHPTVKPPHRNVHKDVGAVAHDPWAQVVSLSTYLASNVPRSLPSFFLSFLHDPQHGTPATAIRNALQSLREATEASNTYSSNNDSEETLVSLLVVLHATLDGVDDLTLEERDRMISDARMALYACEIPEAALDLVKRLRELDIDEREGMTQGLYHSRMPPTQASIPSMPHTPGGHVVKQLVHPPDIQPLKHPPKMSVPQHTNSEQWHTIAGHATRNHAGSHRLAEAIPAYRTGYKSRTIPRNVCNTKDPAAAGIIMYRSRQQQAIAKRNEMLLQASHHWRQRTAGAAGTGAGVAFFYAERARKFAEESKEWGLKTARATVEQKRYGSPSMHNTVDLHGLTVEEAVSVVREILDEGQDGCSQDRPLKIITGIGKHSHKGVGVLAPAVHNVLVQDGWNVSKFDAGVVVRGKA